MVVSNKFAVTITKTPWFDHKLGHQYT